MNGLKLHVEITNRRAQWREPALTLFLASQVVFAFVAVPISAMGLFPSVVLGSMFGLILFCACVVVAADSAAVIGTIAAALASVAATLVYFSYASLTTTGFGDVTPVQPLIRSLATFEALLGQLYPATLLARMVTLELEGRRNNHRDD